MLSTIYKQSSSGVWHREENFNFDYSDGDEIENRLLKQVQQANDVSLASDELQRLMVDWPSEYHFSPLRANILSSFSFNQFNNILEIGSGCGAITRVLAEQCTASNIVALEGSMRRAEITRARCRDIKNLTVLRDSFKDFEHNDVFDLITMIGVLEYSPSYFSGNNPILDALKQARRLLSADGALVIAIENQLGLKYFNGCAEDHNGEPFFGINDQYKPGTFRTFGREQLRNQLYEAGYERVEFVYPFPDYKLPQLLLREESFHCNGLDLSHLVGQYPSRDYCREGNRIFQEERVWNVVSQNGLLRDFANSFLVFAFPGKKTLADITDKWVAKVFSGRRKKRFLVETEFRKEQGEIVVEKKLSYPDSTRPISENVGTTRHHVGRVKYIEGIPYRYTLQEKVTKDDALTELINYLTPWVDWLRKKSFSQTVSSNVEKNMVPGEFYDCMPANFIIGNQDQLFLIDQEWEHQNPLELGFLLFRGVYWEISTNLEFFEQTDFFTNGTIWDVLVKIYNAFDLPLDKGIFASYLDLEITFQLEVGTYNIGKDGLINHLNCFFEETRKQKSGFAERDSQIAMLNRLLVERDKEISALFQSHSWRLTAPLRVAGYLIRGDFDKVSFNREKIRQWSSSSLKRVLRWLLSKISKIVETETNSHANIAALGAIIEERCQVSIEHPLSDPLSAPPPEILPEVDISVVTYNSKKWVAGFVESLILLDYPKSLLNVFFVDNTSTDSTFDTLIAEISKLKEIGCSVDILTSKNRGYGAGHNRAIKEGSAPFCLVSNIDLTFDPAALQSVVSVAVADNKASAWELRQKPYEHPKFYDPVTGTTNWNSHACVLLRRSTFEKVKGYDENLFMYGEDVELSYRLRCFGELLRYCPNAVVHHYCYDHAEQIKPLQHSGSIFANFYLRLKYGKISDILAIPFLVIQVILAPEPYSGARRAIFNNLMRLLGKTPKALLGRRRGQNKVCFPFYTWEYEMMREGAFVEQIDLPLEPPLVSIITRTFKGRELYLQQAMLSVAHQSYPNIEHIIVEDGSALLQPVVEQIGQLTGKPALYLNIDKLGRSEAGNVGLENSTGRWCMFLDDDDLLFSEHVEQLVCALTKHTEAVAAYSLAWELYTDSDEISEGKYTELRYDTPSFLGDEYDYNTLEHRNLMAIQSVLFERRLFEERGGFDTDMDALEDWGLWLCYGFGNEFFYVPKVTSMFRTPSCQAARESRQNIHDAMQGAILERARLKIDDLGLKRVKHTLDVAYDY